MNGLVWVAPSLRPAKLATFERASERAVGCFVPKGQNPFPKSWGLSTGVSQLKCLKPVQGNWGALPVHRCRFDDHADVALSMV